VFGFFFFFFFPFENMALARSLGIVCVTSAIEAHPSLELIAYTLRTVGVRLRGAQSARLVVVCDGCAVSRSARRGNKLGKVDAALGERYAVFRRRLRRALMGQRIDWDDGVPGGEPGGESGSSGDRRPVDDGLARLADNDDQDQAVDPDNHPRAVTVGARGAHRGPRNSDGARLASSARDFSALRASKHAASERSARWLAWGADDPSRVTMIEKETNCGFAGCLRTGIEVLAGEGIPNVLVVQHDWILGSALDAEAVLRDMHEHNMDYVVFTPKGFSTLPERIAGGEFGDPGPNNGVIVCTGEGGAAADADAEADSGVEADAGAEADAGVEADPKQFPLSWSSSSPSEIQSNTPTQPHSTGAAADPAQQVPLPRRPPVAIFQGPSDLAGADSTEIPAFAADATLVRGDLPWLTTDDVPAPTPAEFDVPRWYVPFPHWHDKPHIARCGLYLDLLSHWNVRRFPEDELGAVVRKCAREQGLHPRVPGVARPARDGDGDGDGDGADPSGEPWGRLRTFNAQHVRTHHADGRRYVNDRDKRAWREDRRAGGKDVSRRREERCRGGGSSDSEGPGFDVFGDESK
jgi:hypothetical protein